MGKTDLALVDSCVLLDIFNDDDNWCQWSVNTLHEASKKYNLAVNIIVFTEISFNFDSRETLSNALQQLNMDVLDIPLDVAFDTSRVFKRYRKRGGHKKTPMPDFYIGAHAQYLKAPLITRDVARYKSYFPRLKLISP